MATPDRASLLAPGQELGKYRLLRPLGCGGSAWVWLAENTFALPGEEDQVALKIPKRQAADQVRLLAEPKLLKKLAHPNIVRVYAAERVGDTFFVVMQYMPGGNLRIRLRQTPRLPAKEVLRLAGGLLRGLAHAHAARIVHRDLKPENLFLTKTHELKIGDFGIARQVAANGRVKGAGGSRAYKAPEQFQGSASPASDVWAVGVILCEMLTGRHPFLPRPGEDIRAAICSRTLPPLPATDSLEEALSRLVKRCLRRDPGARLPTAAPLLQVVEDLAAATA